MTLGMSSTVKVMLYDVASCRGSVNEVSVVELDDDRVEVTGPTGDRWSWTAETLRERVRLARRAEIAEARERMIAERGR